MLTKRQWVILQAAVGQLDLAVSADKSGGWMKCGLHWDHEEDGPEPTLEELNEVAVFVANLPVEQS